MSPNLEDRLYEARLRRSLPDPAVRKMLRARFGIAQQAIADEIGCSREEISRFESGARNPSRRLLLPYVRVLNRLQEELSRIDA